VRVGLIVSVVIHLLTLVGIVLAGPRTFVAVPEQAIAVDLVAPVTAQEPAAQEEAKGTPAADNVERAESDAPARAAQERAPPEESRPSQADEKLPAPRLTERRPDAPKLENEPPPRTAPQTMPPVQATPQPKAPRTAESAPSTFDVANIPALYALSTQAPGGRYAYSGPAEEPAMLGDIATQLKSHLRRCWKAPDLAGNTASLRVVVRVLLERNGSLRADPLLVSAPASRDGPALAKAAIDALEACQPYDFLPAARYEDWKALDIGLTEREMAGG
jgi:hypothetical protein